MKYRNIFGTAVLTAFLPAIASAATVAIVDTTDGSGSITEALTPGYSTTLDIVDSGGVVSDFEVFMTFETSDQATDWDGSPTVAFTVANNSTDYVSFSLLEGNVRQSPGASSGIGDIPSYGFTSALSDWFDPEDELGGVVVTVDGSLIEAFPYGENDSFETSGIIAPESSVVLGFDFDNVVCSTSNCPSIDFSIDTIVAPVPVPAAGFLLLGGLGGLAMMRRRKKS